MHLGVIGCGVVGEALAKGFESKGARVARYDKYKEGIDQFESILETPTVFICVPSPTIKEARAQSVDAVMDVFEKLSVAGYAGNIVLKSTVLPGTTNDMAERYKLTRVIHNPEFLTAAKAEADFLTQPAVLLGSKNFEAMLEVADLYRQFRICQEFYFANDPAYSEVAKYMHNLFLSVKVGFLNEMKIGCDKMGISYEQAIKMAVSQGGIGSGHTKVPGPDGLPGFSGMCFIKDTLAFAGFSDIKAIPSKILNAAIESNMAIRPQAYDGRESVGCI